MQQRVVNQAPMHRVLDAFLMLLTQLNRYLELNAEVIHPRRILRLQRNHLHARPFGR